MKDLYKFLMVAIATAPTVAFSDVAVPPLTALYLPTIEALEKEGATMSYARKRLAFIETRLADKYYPMPVKVAEQSTECAIRYNLREEVKRGTITEAKGAELENNVINGFCEI